LGGLTTLIGTPPNILVSEILRENDLEPFGMFDFTPVGGAVLLAGIAFIAVAGRHLLPERDVRRESQGDDEDLGAIYSLGDELNVLVVPRGSALAGTSLADSRLGAVLGLNVLGILRSGKRDILAPGSDSILEEGDRLLVEGRTDRLQERAGREYFDLEPGRLSSFDLLSRDVVVMRVEILPGCTFTGETLKSMNFRHSYGTIVLAIRRGDTIRRTQLETMELETGDVLLIQGSPDEIDILRSEPHLEISFPEAHEMEGLEERLMVVKLPADSPLVGATLAGSRLGDSFGIGVMGIVRGGTTNLMPDPEEVLRSGDSLLIKGRREALDALGGLRGLELAADQTASEVVALESEQVGLAEVILSPRSTLEGKSLVDLHFREKYGLSVVAISRSGTIHRDDLRDMALRLGDALLLHGPREKLTVLGSEPDFLVLSEETAKPVRLSKAPLAALIMGSVVLSVVVGFLPIYIAAVAGAVAMVMTGCLSMDEAYRAIEWKAVFLIAGMLPLGIAMQKSGAATYLTHQVVALVGDFGPMAVVSALFLVTALSAQVMPTSAVAILMAPIALNTASDLAISHKALMIAVAAAASSSFMSPVAHPANVLIMGPGGYRFVDYVKVGLPLTIVCLVTVLLVLPAFWPLTP
ncbi:MAG: SLC13 family permease, partial [Acidobacteriota bacterium]|nr:SLC13 family permease [Acidobacteriota bacterium]